MNQLIKTICLILITLAILVGVGFYSWSIFQKNQKEQLKGECFSWCQFQDWRGVYQREKECEDNCKLNPRYHFGKPFWQERILFPEE